jgi:hypothetical protein
MTREVPATGTLAAAPKRSKQQPRMHETRFHMFLPAKTKCYQPRASVGRPPTLLREDSHCETRNAEIPQKEQQHR